MQTLHQGSLGKMAKSCLLQRSSLFQSGRMDLNHQPLVSKTSILNRIEIRPVFSRASLGRIQACIFQKSTLAIRQWLGVLSRVPR